MKEWDGRMVRACVFMLQRGNDALDGVAWLGLIYVLKA